MALTNTVRWRVVGSADTRGLTIENLRESDELRRISWLVAPVHNPGWYVADTSFHLRSAGHVYTLPGPERGSGFDSAAWAAPGVDNLQNIKPPSGFPNICLSIRTIPATNVGPTSRIYRFRVTGLDCMLRKVEETIQIESINNAAAAIQRAWGRVGWRQVEKIEVIELTELSGVGYGTRADMTLVAEDLYIGWDFVNTQVVATWYDTPERDDDGAGNPNWLTGLPFKMKRDATLGATTHVHNVDGVVEMDFDSFPYGSNANVKTRANAVRAAGFYTGGWFGSDGWTTSLAFNGGSFVTDQQEPAPAAARLTWRDLNVWAPAAAHRPNFSSGKDATPDPINTVTLNAYAFFLHEWRDVPALQDFED